MASVVEIKLTLDSSSGTSTLAQFAAALTNVQNRQGRIKINVDTALASKSLSDLESMRRSLKAKLEEKIQANVSIASLEKTKSVLEAVESKLERIKGSSDIKLGGAPDSIGNRMVQLNQGIELFSKFKGLISSPIDKAASFESYIIQFKVLLGSAEAAEKRIRLLSDFANATPFEMPEVVQASKLLQTFGGDLLATGEPLTMVGDMASASGQGFAEIASWVGRAYTAIQSGRPFGESAQRLQELGLMSGQTRQKLEDMQKSGKSGTEVWKEFTASMAPYKGMMAEQAGSFAGMTSTMDDAISQFERDTAKEFMPTLKGVVSGITSMVGTLGSFPPALKVVTAGLALSIPTVIAFGAAFGATPYIILGVATALGAIYTAFQSGNYLVAGLTTLLAPLALGLVAVKLGFIGAATGASGFSLSLGVLTTAVKGLFGAFTAFLATPAGMILVGVAAVAGITAAIITYYKDEENARAKHNADVKKSNEDAVSVMNARISKLSKAKQVEAAVWEEAEARKTIATLENRYKTAQAWGAESAELQQIQERIYEQTAIITAAQKIQADGGIKLTAAEISATKAKIKTIDDLITTDEEYQKQLADIDRALKGANVSERERIELLQMRKKVESELNASTARRDPSIGYQRGDRTFVQSDYSSDKKQSAAERNKKAGAQMGTLKGVDVADVENTFEELDTLSSAFQGSMLSGIDSLVQAINGGFRSAWTGVFGEANSLLEIFAQSFVETLAQLAVKMAIFKGLGAIPGLGGIATLVGSSFGFLARGGQVKGPGGPTDDQVPAMLSNGEFVVNAESTRRYLPQLQAINSGRKYADGGLVASVSMIPSSRLNSYAGNAPSVSGMAATMNRIDRRLSKQKAPNVYIKSSIDMNKYRVAQSDLERLEGTRQIS